MSASSIERRTEVDGYEMRYLRAGEEGSPVLLLHGGIIDAAHVSWDEVIEPLAADHRVFAPDLLGYGYSDTPDIAYTTKRHVAVVEGFMDSVGLDHANVIGLSLGGAVAIGLVLRSPERVSGLVAVASYGLGRELPNGRLTYALSRVPAINRLSVAILARSRWATAASLGALVADPASVTPELIEQVRGLARLPHAGRAFRSWRYHEVGSKGFRTDYRPRLGDLDAPTLFVHGEADKVFPPAWSRRAAEIADADHWLVENCGHLVSREHPEAFTERVGEFLD